jgi:hypothetical protein
MRSDVTRQRAKPDGEGGVSGRSQKRLARRGVVAIVLGLALGTSCGYSESDLRRLTGTLRFTELHARAQSLHFKNVCVLPEDEFIVIDGTVINLGKRTFGEEPAGSFFQAYYDRGSERSFQSLPALLEERGVRITEEQLSDLIFRMKSLGVGDIAKDLETGVILYSWRMSGMWGSDGVLFLPSGRTVDDLREEFTELKPIRNGFHYWQDR